MKATLRREEGGANLRTDEVTGEAERPVPGRRFQMMAPALYPETGAVGRLIETSTVTSVVETWTKRRGTEFVFTTRSGSLYRLKVLS